MAESIQTVQAKLDAIVAQAATEKQEADAKWSAAEAKQAAAATEIADLKSEIDALKAAGANAVTQEQLDSLGTRADSALTAVGAIVVPDAPQVPPVE